MLFPEEELQRELNLPVIGGYLIVYPKPITYSKYPEDEGTTISWYIWLIFSGPDARYNPAIVELVPHDVQKFIYLLEQINHKIKSFSVQPMTGSFSKSYYLETRSRNSIIDILSPPVIKLNGRGQDFWIEFWLSSETQMFSRTINPSQLQEIIDKLKLTPRLAQAMSQELIKILYGATVRFEYCRLVLQIEETKRHNLVKRVLIGGKEKRVFLKVFHKSTKQELFVSTHSFPVPDQNWSNQRLMRWKREVDLERRKISRRLKAKGWELTKIEQSANKYMPVFTYWRQSV